MNMTYGMFRTCVDWRFVLFSRRKGGMNDLWLVLISILVLYFIVRRNRAGARDRKRVERLRHRQALGCDLEDDDEADDRVK